MDASNCTSAGAATDVFFTANAPPCEANVPAFLGALIASAVIEAAVAAESWRLWAARLVKHGRKTRPPLAASLFTGVSALIVLLLVLALTGIANYSNGVPLLLLGMIWALHMTYVWFALRRHIAFGENIFFLTSSLQGAIRDEQHAGIRDSKRIVRRLDVVLRIVFGALAVSIMAVVIVCVPVNLALPLEPWVFNTTIILFLLQFSLGNGAWCCVLRVCAHRRGRCDVQRAQSTSSRVFIWRWAPTR